MKNAGLKNRAVDLREEHERVPPLHFNSDHQVLRKDESGERDAHHVNKALFK